MLLCFNMTMTSALLPDLPDGSSAFGYERGVPTGAEARQAWLQLNGESSDPMETPSLREQLKDRAKSITFSSEWRAVGGFVGGLGAKQDWLPQKWKAKGVAPAGTSYLHTAKLGSTGAPIHSQDPLNRSRMSESQDL